MNKLFSNNWVVTLTATLIGVFAALYLNEWVNDQRLSQSKSKATTDLLEEVDKNHEELQNGLEYHKNMQGAIGFLSEHTNEEGKIISSVEDMLDFRSGFDELISIKDSIPFEEGLFHYTGQLNMDFQIYHLNLSNIAWKTLNSSGLSSSYDFDCLLYLEGLDRLSVEVSEMNKVLIEYMKGERDSGEKNEMLLQHLMLLIDFEKSLIEQYNNSEDKMKSCL